MEVGRNKMNDEIFENALVELLEAVADQGEKGRNMISKAHAFTSQCVSIAEADTIFGTDLLAEARVICFALDNESEKQAASWSTIKEKCKDANYSGLYSSVTSTRSYNEVNNLISLNIAQKAKVAKSSEIEARVLQGLQMAEKGDILSTKQLQDLASDLFEFLKYAQGKPTGTVLKRLVNVCGLIVQQSTSRIATAVRLCNTVAHEIKVQGLERTDINKELATLVSQTAGIHFHDVLTTDGFWQELLADKDIAANFNQHRKTLANLQIFEKCGKVLHNLRDLKLKQVANATEQLFSNMSELESLVSQLVGAEQEPLQVIVKDLKATLDMSSMANTSFSDQRLKTIAHTTSLIKHVHTSGKNRVSFKANVAHVNSLVDANHKMHQLCAYAEDSKAAVAFADGAQVLARCCADDATLDAISDCSAKGGASKKKFAAMFGTQFTGALRAWRRAADHIEADSSRSWLTQFAPDSTEEERTAFECWLTNIKGQVFLPSTWGFRHGLLIRIWQHLVAYNNINI